MLAALQLAPALSPWLAPVLVGFVVAVPFARFTNSERLGDAARQRGWFLIPEEKNPPPELSRVHDRLLLRENPHFLRPPYSEHYGLLQAVLDPHIHAMHVSLLRLREEGTDRNREYAEQLMVEGPGNATAEVRRTV